MIGGIDEEYHVSADCLICDIWFKHWSVTPSSMNMLMPRSNCTTAVLDGKVVVASGMDGHMQVLSSTEFIDVVDLLEYAPLYYPLL